MTCGADMVVRSGSGETNTPAVNEVESNRSVKKPDFCKVANFYIYMTLSRMHFARACRAMLHFAFAFVSLR